ncbi:MAG: hypothetical protein MJ106_06785 [Lentisphaeria bacterium]|nr:hypothetical protein [Lentisphaeria bacterium]
MLFLKIILVLSLMLTGISCKGKAGRQSGRHRKYDLGRSEALLEAGEAFLSEDACWEDLAHSALLGDRLTGILRDDVSRRELFQAANALLQQERLNDLAALIDDAEKRGEATPALLELRGLPRALQALSLFCARRPYQKAQDLEQSLNFLSPWCEELSRLAPEAFPPFLESQNALLNELLEKEKRERVLALQKDFCHAVTTSGGIGDDPISILVEIASVDETAEILDYMSPDMTMRAGLKTALLAGEWSEALELSSFVCWKHLDSETRSAMASLLEDGAVFTLAGNVLKARVHASAKEFLDAIQQWQKECPTEELTTAYPSFLEESLESLKEDKPTVNSPVIDFSEASEIFLKMIP